MSYDKWIEPMYEKAAEARREKNQQELLDRAQLERELRMSVEALELARTRWLKAQRALFDFELARFEPLAFLGNSRAGQGE